MKRAALYTRVSTFDQTTQNQIYDLRALAEQRSLQITKEYTDHGISGARARRPGLDQLMTDAAHHRFDVLLIWSCDRLARSTKHFLEVIDELSRLQIEFVSFRENLDTGGPLGRAVVVIISAIAELERSLIVERVKAGLRRAKLEGRQIGRPPVQVDRVAVLRDRAQGRSLRQIAKTQRISRATVCRVLSEVEPGWPKTPENVPSRPRDFTGSETPT
ncbi:MAG: recombinase family protein [Terriglobales bacterium]